MTPKTILIVYPHNLFSEKSGINSRYLSLLHYFKDRGITVDMLTLTGFQSSWDQYPPDNDGLVRHLFFFDFKKGSRGQKQRNKKRNLWASIRKRIPFCTAHHHLPDFAYPAMKKQTEALAAAHRYDAILISYAYWTGLIENREPQGALAKTETILDLSDFLTMNRYDITSGNINQEKMIKEEIRRVNHFDRVLYIAQQEGQFFIKNAPHPTYHYVPFFMETPKGKKETKPTYDLIFTGSANPHNQKGIHWFLNQVFPLLLQPGKPAISMAVVGPICDYVPKHPCITPIPFIQDMGSVYLKSKIAISPLLGGTGMKIKTIEALSYGLPLVCTEKGATGLPKAPHTGCEITDSPQTFADSVEKLLTDQDHYHHQHQKAKTFFTTHFEKSTVYNTLDTVFTISTG